MVLKEISQKDEIFYDFHGQYLNFVKHFIVVSMVNGHFLLYTSQACSNTSYHIDSTFPELSSFKPSICIKN